MVEFEGYCMKCRKKVKVKDGKEVIKETKTGKMKFYVGTCPYCGTKVYRVVGKA